LRTAYVEEALEFNGPFEIALDCKFIQLSLYSNIRHQRITSKSFLHFLQIIIFK